MGLSDISGVSNSELWNLARKFSPHFASHTSEGTKDTFTEKGFEALKRTDVTAINEFFEISLRIALQKIDVSRAKNLFEGSGLLQYYNTPNGGYVQRMAVNSIKPVTPKYRGLENGDSIDPFVVRKPEVSERFFQQNFDYQSFITLQDFQVKTIFVSEYGMGEFVAGVMQGLRNGYTIQESVNVKEALNSAINSTDYPLQDTQVMNVDWDTAPSDAQLLGFIKGVKSVATNMRTTEQTSCYNAGKFATRVDDEDYVLLVRSGVKDSIQLQLEVGAFNPDRLTLPFETLEVDNFGGLVPTYTPEGGSPMDMVTIYGPAGDVVGFVPEYDDIVVNGDPFKASGVWKVNISYTDENSDTVTEDVTVTENPDYTDPNADVVAVLCQKGLVFENRQNAYELSPIYNPRGMYSNFFANCPGNSIVVDPNYNMVVFRGTSD